MIASAIAVGITATFGTPIGGVLFSIELSANVYNIQNLWKAFYAATLSVAIFKLSTLYADVQLFDGSDFHYYANDKLILHGLNKEIPFFIILAIFCSLLGCLYIYIHKVYVTMKKRRSDWWCFNPWVYSLFIAFLISSIQYFTKLTQDSDRKVLKSFFGIDKNLEDKNSTISDDIDQDYNRYDYDDLDDTERWQYGEQYMIMYIVLKFIFTFLSLSCNVPSGIFTPIYVLGAVFG
jgi:chloride channel 2